MANTIKMRRSGVPGKVPEDLAIGELALNFADGILYFKVIQNGEHKLFKVQGSEVGAISGGGSDYGNLSQQPSAVLDYGSITSQATALVDYGSVVAAQPTSSDWGGILAAASTFIDHGAITAQPTTTANLGDLQ